jgi:hypothetical protein
MKRLLLFIVALFVLHLGSVRIQGSSKSEIEILRVGQFHGKEVSAKSGEMWFGLYLTMDGYELIPSEITVETCYDDVRGENTGKKVLVDQPKEPLFLIKGLENLKSGPVNTVFSGAKFLHPAESMTLKLGENGYYTLVGFGKAVDRGVARPFDIAIRNYKIEISRYPWVHTQVIASFNIIAMDGLPTLLWAGDLDRDGKLDLVMDLTDHYNVSEYVLFLSSMSEGNNILRKVATFRTVGC